MNVMLLEATFSFSLINNKNIAGEGICKVRATLAPRSRVMWSGNYEQQ